MTARTNHHTASGVPAVEDQRAALLARTPNHVRQWLVRGEITLADVELLARIHAAAAEWLPPIRSTGPSFGAEHGRRWSGAEDGDGAARRSDATEDGASGP